MAASLDRWGPWAVERRMRRLLPSLWVLAAVSVPAMLAAGMIWDWRVLLWGFPLQDPPAIGHWMEALSATWYLRDFLWFVLISPIVLPIFRRFPLATVLIPYAGLLVIEFGGFTVHTIVRDFAIYFGPWVLGFAHHDGKLRFKRRLPVAAVLAVAGLGWTFLHPGPRGFDINDIPLGNALWSVAFILLTLGVAPYVRPTRLVTVLNARALTIYLWHVPVIVALGLLGLSGGWRLPVILGSVAVIVLLVGWVEDLAAERRPALIPRLVRPARAGAPEVVRPRAARRAELESVRG
jgi:peptidoglycan/LPS O-acetylase OafA/YrhL